MIQDINPHRFVNDFRAIGQIGNNDYILHYKNQALLLKKNGEEFELPRRKDFHTFREDSHPVYLFELNDTPCFLDIDSHIPEGAHFTFQEISFFRTVPQKEIAWIAIVGFHLMSWYMQNQFCGICGKPTQRKKEERAITCPSCNSTVYPKISPAIIVAIVCKDKMLLAHNANFQDNFYSLVAGYADIGESLEEAVVREVKEEVGLDVKNIRYYKSQPWPFSGSMMIGFVAEADDQQPIRVDNKEIHNAQWFSKDNLPNHPKTISIAGEMIEMFENNLLF